MAVPPLTKTYVGNTNQRITFTTVPDANRNFVLAYIGELVLRGFTVKGSSDGTTAAMDGVNRIVDLTDFVRGTAAATVQTWIVLEHAGMSGAEIMIGHQGTLDSHFKVSFSSSGVWTLAGTPTHQPTATDEVIILVAGSNIAGGGAADRVWSARVASDGSGVFFTVFTGNVVNHQSFIGKATSMVESPTFWTNPIWGTMVVVSAGLTLGNSFASSVNAAAYISSAVTNLFWGTFGFGTGAANSQTNCTGPWASLGNDFVLHPVTLCSNVAVGRAGAAGRAIDIWAAPTTGIVQGETLGVANHLIIVGHYAQPWDGSAPVTA